MKVDVCIHMFVKTLCIIPRHSSTLCSNSERIINIMKYVQLVIVDTILQVHTGRQNRYTYMYTSRCALTVKNDQLHLHVYCMLFV